MGASSHASAQIGAIGSASSVIENWHASFEVSAFD
jgi:hypothetical protein